MRIVLENEYGCFEMGGGSHASARIISAAGFGVVGKEVETATFEGQAGRTTTSVRDVERTITLSIDFNGGQHEIERLYRIIYYPVDILCFFGDGRRRKIRGRLIDSTDYEQIIYHKLQSAVLQFVCDDPYFHDFGSTVIKIATHIDLFPNVIEGNVWYVQLPAVATSIEKTVTVNNRGVTMLYPVIKIRSNKSANDSPDDYGVTVKNLTTYKKITLNYNLSAEETITMNLPERKIISNINGNITNYISNDTVLSDFFLKVGENDINISSLNINDNISGEIEFTNNYIAAVI